MNAEQIKEANRYYWIVKGQLIPVSWSLDQIEKIYYSYMERIWGNHENVVHETGFEEAWNKRLTEVKEPRKEG